jgi:S-adenosylmethionine decarboxylase
MRILGRHLVAELSDCPTELLNDPVSLEKTMKEAARVSGATVVNSAFHHYNPQGMSGIVIIAESHISVHTWPEYGYAAIDCFTCGSAVDPWKAIDFLKNALKCSSIKVSEIKRGIPSSEDEIIAHKTIDQDQTVSSERSTL